MRRPCEWRTRLNFTLADFDHLAHPSELVRFRGRIREFTLEVTSGDRSGCARCVYVMAGDGPDVPLDGTALRNAADRIREALSSTTKF